MFHSRIVFIFSVDTIEYDAIDLISNSASIAHNELKNLGQNWLRVIDWHKVIVHNNTFGKFNSLSLESPLSTADNVECIIKHNSFTQIEESGLKSISDKCRFTELMFKENCGCRFHEWLRKRFSSLVLSKTLESESFCTLFTSDSNLECLQGQTIKYLEYKEEICKGRRHKFKCNKIAQKVKKIDAKFIDSKSFADDFDWMEHIHFIIGGILVVIITPCICITIAVRRKSRNIASDHYAHGTMHHQTDLLQLNQSEGPPSYEASLRSTKIFSNHDQIVIKRTLELMKLKQPKDKYEIVYNHTKRLLHEHLNEYEKVRVIGDIVQTIGECENSGEDFVAFTDILYKHLAPDTTTTPRTATTARAPPIEGLYAEPGLPHVVLTPRKAPSEHIYAEPTALSKQQTMIPLLLSNNYSNPVDNNINNNNNNNVYSEPVVHETKIGKLVI